MAIVKLFPSGIVKYPIIFDERDKLTVLRNHFQATDAEIDSTTGFERLLGTEHVSVQVYDYNSGQIELILDKVTKMEKM